jgi:hypothetical protein
VAEGGTVYSKLEEAFYLAIELGWTREQFMLAAQNVSKGTSTFLSCLAS